MRNNRREKVYKVTLDDNTECYMSENEYAKYVEQKREKEPSMAALIAGVVCVAALRVAISTMMDN